MITLGQIFLSKATTADIPHIFTLINSYAQQELLLPRPLGALYETIRDFVLVRDEKQQIIATGALHIIWDNLGEIRSLAVDPQFVGTGIGRILVDFMKEEARELKIKDLFALTYKPGFFQKCGFTIVSKDIFPQKVWVECVNCIKFPNCDEVAVKLTLNNPIPK
jgi:amino-acid N-acetyltransferase